MFFFLIPLSISSDLSQFIFIFIIILSSLFNTAFFQMLLDEYGSVANLLHFLDHDVDVGLTADLVVVSGGLFDLEVTFNVEFVEHHVLALVLAHTVEHVAHHVLSQEAPDLETLPAGQLHVVLLLDPVLEVEFERGHVLHSQNVHPLLHVLVGCSAEDELLQVLALHLVGEHLLLEHADHLQVVPRLFYAPLVLRHT